jgi:hypothetical protein
MRRDAQIFLIFVRTAVSVNERASNCVICANIMSEYESYRTGLWRIRAHLRRLVFNTSRRSRLPCLP